jgi:hypothetical protein
MMPARAAGLPGCLLMILSAAVTVTAIVLMALHL